MAPVQKLALVEIRPIILKCAIRILLQFESLFLLLYKTRTEDITPAPSLPFVDLGE